MRSAAEYGEAPAIGRAPPPAQGLLPREQAVLAKARAERNQRKQREVAEVAERARAREAALEAKLRARLAAFVADSAAAEVGSC